MPTEQQNPSTSVAGSDDSFSGDHWDSISIGSAISSLSFDDDTLLTQRIGSMCVSDIPIPDNQHTSINSSSTTTSTTAYAPFDSNRKNYWLHSLNSNPTITFDPLVASTLSNSYLKIIDF